MTLDQDYASGEDVDLERRARSVLRRRERSRLFAGLFVAGLCAIVAIGAVWFARSSSTRLAMSPSPPSSEPSAVVAQPLPREIAIGEDMVGTTPPSAAPSGAVDLPRIIPPSPAPSAAAAPPAPPAPSPGTDETRQFIARARDFLAKGDLSTARLFFERAADHGDAQGAFALAETYDPLALARWKARGVTADIGKARALYAQAQRGGVADADKRITELAGR